MNSLLRSLRRQRIVAVDAWQYFSLGLAAADCRTALGAAIRFRSVELDGAPFEAYLLAAAEGPLEDGAIAGMEIVRHVWNLDVERIEVFTRDEWAEPDAVSVDTLGKNPMSIDTGPVGSAPAGTRTVTVTCGVAFHSNRHTASSLLIYVADYPGLVGLSAEATEIAAFRDRTTTRTWVAKKAM
jgi:hypothetical protein